jgi:hypothetical protein
MTEECYENIHFSECRELNPGETAAGPCVWRWRQAGGRGGGGGGDRHCPLSSLVVAPLCACSCLCNTLLRELEGHILHPSKQCIIKTAPYK